MWEVILVIDVWMIILFIYRITWWVLLRCTEFTKNYLVSTAENDFFTSDVEVGLETLFERSIRKFLLERGGVRKPITEKQLAAVHSIVASVLEVEHAHPWLKRRKSLDEGIPIGGSLSDGLIDLAKNKSTTFSSWTL